jgi:hypothetical protein
VDFRLRPGPTQSSAAPPRSGRIQPDRFRLLLLVIRPARPTLAEVPLADLPFNPTHEPIDGIKLKETA